MYAGGFPLAFSTIVPVWGSMVVLAVVLPRGVLERVIPVDDARRPRDDRVLVLVLLEVRQDLGRQQVLRLVGVGGRRACRRSSDRGRPRCRRAVALRIRRPLVAVHRPGTRARGRITASRSSSPNTRRIVIDPPPGTPQRRRAARPRPCRPRSSRRDGSRIRRRSARTPRRRARTSPSPSRAPR